MGTEFMSLSGKPVCGGGSLVTVALLSLAIFSDPAKTAPALKQQDINSEATIQNQVESKNNFFGAVDEANKHFATPGEAKGVTTGRKQHDGLQNSIRSEDSKALITKMKEQLELQSTELDIWREHADIDRIIGNIMMVITALIALLTVCWTLMSVWILPKIIQFQKIRKKLSKLPELEMRLAEIQLISFREALDQLQQPTNAIDTGLANLTALEISTHLKRLTAVAEDVIATSCDSLPQLLELLPKTKAKVISFVAWLLGSDLLSDANYNKRIEKLLSNLSE